jgi:hypothetical protein
VAYSLEYENGIAILEEVVTEYENRIAIVLYVYVYTYFRGSCLISLCFSRDDKLLIYLS